MEVDPAQILEHVKSQERFKGELDAYWESMKKLPEYDYSQFYASYPEYPNTIAQGDVLKDLIFVSLPDTETMEGRGIIMSSTCDIELTNQRKYPVRIIYAPLIKLEAYKGMLSAATDDHGQRKQTDSQIESHLDAIRRQKIGQIFYLPANNADEEAIVFFGTYPLTTSNFFATIRVCTTNSP